MSQDKRGIDVCSQRACPDCGVMPGFTHKQYCDVEMCTHCGGQRLSCACPEELHNPIRAVWTGLWPGDNACSQLGWYVKMEDGNWIACSGDDPDSRPDINRWIEFTMNERRKGVEG